jgi:hypothetical protein
MSDEVNKNPIPRVVKGTGFYTPMDMAPGETPSEVSMPSPVREMTGLPTAMHIEPPTSATPQPVSGSPQTSDGSNNAQND